MIVERIKKGLLGIAGSVIIWMTVRRMKNTLDIWSMGGKTQ